MVLAIGARITKPLPIIARQTYNVGMEDIIVYIGRLFLGLGTIGLVSVGLHILLYSYLESTGFPMLYDNVVSASVISVMIGALLVILGIKLRG